MVELPDLLAEDAVRRETADIGFSIGVPQPAEQFEYVRLRHYQLCAVVHPDHPPGGAGESQHPGPGGPAPGDQEPLF